MRSSIYFLLLALISSPVLAAPTFASERRDETSQATTVFDPSRFRIGTVVPGPSSESGWNRLFGIGPVILPKAKGASLPMEGNKPTSDFWNQWPDLGPMKSTTSKRAAPGPGPHPSKDFLMSVFIRGLDEMAKSSTSKRAPLFPMSQPQNLQDGWSDYINKFMASHPNSMFTRDMSEQDRVLWNLVKGAQAAPNQ